MESFLHVWDADITGWEASVPESWVGNGVLGVERAPGSGTADDRGRPVTLIVTLPAWALKSYAYSKVA